MNWPEFPGRLAPASSREGGLSRTASAPCGDRGLRNLSADEHELQQMLGTLGASQGRKWPSRAAMRRSRYRQVARLRGLPGAHRRGAHVRIRYQCALHHANSPFYPIIDQLERAANFKPGDAPDIKLDKLAAALSSMGASTLADIRSCAALLSIPTAVISGPAPAPERQKDITIYALIRQILALSQGLPVVIELADAHWADSSTLELFSRIIASIRTDARIRADEFQAGVLPAMARSAARDDAAARPARTRADRGDDPRRGWTESIARGDGRPDYRQDRRRSRCSSRNSPSRFWNPACFTMPATGWSPQAGCRPLAIPTTLLGSLTARLDRLGAAKEIAQIGAAIGREFSYRLLAAVAPISGPSLQAALAQLIAPN